MLLSQLPILMRVSLHTPLQLTGFALALPPLCELVLMPAMAYAARTSCLPDDRVCGAGRRVARIALTR